MDPVFYGLRVLQPSRALANEGMDGNTFHAFLPSSVLNVFLRREATLFSEPKTV